MDIRTNLGLLKKQIPAHVTLVAVSKNHGPEHIKEAFAAGQIVFGENRVQELTFKYPLLPENIEWHFIGHLQTNKVKQIAPFVRMIHSIDSLKLLEEVNQEAQKNDRIIGCLLQFHIAREETKYGLNMEEAEALLESQLYKKMGNISICGVMGMASFIDDMEAVRLEFRQLNSFFQQLKQHYFKDKNEFKEISMGMSQDFLIAIEEGSTMVRIGTAVFG